jgi:hypothetical protein
MVGWDWMNAIDSGVVGPSTLWPGSGGLYIEADASGSCWISATTFSLHVADHDGGGGWTGDIGVVYFVEKTGAWSQDAAGMAHARVENSHPQAKLTVDIVER